MTKALNYALSKRYDNMMARCYRITDRNYRNGGCLVCKEWIASIDAFKAWALQQLEKQSITEEQFCNGRFHLDRIDNSGHYTPDNCRWATPQQNARNRAAVKTRKFLAADGTWVET